MEENTGGDGFPAPFYYVEDFLSSLTDGAGVSPRSRRASTGRRASAWRLSPLTAGMSSTVNEYTADDCAVETLAESSNDSPSYPTAISRGTAPPPPGSHAFGVTTPAAVAQDCSSADRVVVIFHDSAKDLPQP